jgi:hypothetical protein
LSYDGLIFCLVIISSCLFLWYPSPNHYHKINLQAIDKNCKKYKVLVLRLSYDCLVASPALFCLVLSCLYLPQPTLFKDQITAVDAKIKRIRVIALSWHTETGHGTRQRQGKARQKSEQIQVMQSNTIQHDLTEDKTSQSQDKKSQSQDKTTIKMQHQYNTITL